MKDMKEKRLVSKNSGDVAIIISERVININKKNYYYIKRDGKIIITSPIYTYEQECYE